MALNEWDVRTLLCIRNLDCCICLTFNLSLVYNIFLEHAVSAIISYHASGRLFLGILPGTIIK
jgi:hypothetical protein